MKEIKTMTFDELAVARREMNDKLGELYAKAANREFKPEEAQEEINLTRELKQIDEQMKVLNRENEHEKALGDRRQETLQAQFRELLKDVPPILVRLPVRFCCLPVRTATAHLTSMATSTLLVPSVSLSTS